MALTGRTLFRYGLEVTQFNSSLDFKNSPVGAQINATLRTGFYSLDGLLTEVQRALNAADPTNFYSYSIDRSVSGGLESRVTLTSTGGYFALLFSTGTRAVTSCAELLGFTSTDYTVGTAHESATSAGTTFLSALPGYNYISPIVSKRVQGSINVSASGQKEAIVFGLESFLEVEFRHETQADVYTTWADFGTWAIQQRPFEVVPIYSEYATYYDVTLDSTAADGKGLAFSFREMLPDFPFYFQTGRLKFKINNVL